MLFEPERNDSRPEPGGVERYCGGAETAEIQQYLVLRHTSCVVRLQRAATLGTRTASRINVEQPRRPLAGITALITFMWYCMREKEVFAPGLWSKLSALMFFLHTRNWRFGNLRNSSPTTGPAPAADK